MISGRRCEISDPPRSRHAARSAPLTRTYSNYYSLLPIRRTSINKLFYLIAIVLLVYFIIMVKALLVFFLLNVLFDLFRFCNNVLN